MYTLKNWLAEEYQMDVELPSHMLIGVADIAKCNTVVNDVTRNSWNSPCIWRNEYGDWFYDLLSHMGSLQNVEKRYPESFTFLDDYRSIFR